MLTSNNIKMFLVIDSFARVMEECERQLSMTSTHNFSLPYIINKKYLVFLYVPSPLHLEGLL